MKKNFRMRNTRKNRHFAIKQNAKSSGRTVIILMSLPVPIHAVIAILRMPRGYGDRMVRAREIIQAVSTSAYVTIAPPVISAIVAMIDTYASAATLHCEKPLMCSCTMG